MQVSFVHVRDGVQRHGMRDFAAVAVSDLVPVRVPPNSHYQSARPTWYCFEGEFVSTRSRMAEAQLRDLHFQGIEAVVAEPFVLHRNERTRKGRTPDFLVVWPDGGSAVVDVVSSRRARQRAVQEHIELMRRACEETGWDYLVLGEPDVVRNRNLKWLADYRAVDFFDEDIAELLLAAATNPSPLFEVAGDDSTHWCTLPVLFHLLWQRMLHTDLARPLNERSVVCREPVG